MKDVYKKSLQEVFEYYESFENGLSSNEALNRLDKNGKNKLKEPKKQSLVLMFLSQFKDTMVILLLIASLFSAVISYISHESYVDTIIILVIVFINAILSFIQEKKADEFALRMMISDEIWEEISQAKLDKEKIEKISKENRIPMSFIVGRLAKNKQIGYTSKFYRDNYKK